MKMGIMYNEIAKKYIFKSKKLSKQADNMVNKMIAIDPELEKYI
jgi:hypothetical protein